MANNHNDFEIIRVTPTLDTNAYAQGDVLFVATAIPNAVIGSKGCSKLIAAYCLSQAHGNADDLDVYFTEGSTALGTINATADIADGDIEAIGLCGLMKVDADVGVTSLLDTSKVNQLINLNGALASQPILLQAASGSTSVYFQAVITSATTPTYAADDLDFIFHIEHR